MEALTIRQARPDKDEAKWQGQVNVAKYCRQGKLGVVRHQQGKVGLTKRHDKELPMRQA